MFCGGNFAVHILGDGDVCSSQVTSYVLLAAVYVKQTKYKYLYLRGDRQNVQEAMP